MATRVPGLPWLLLGGRREARDRELLVREKVRYILNMTPTRVEDPEAGVSNYFAKDERFQYKRCPLYDNESQSIAPYLDGCLQFLCEGRHYGTVFVHCAQGISRSCAVALAAMMMLDRVPLDRALARLKRKRPQAQPNRAFLRDLEQFERTLGIKRSETVPGSGPSPCGAVTRESAAETRARMRALLAKEEETAALPDRNEKGAMGPIGPPRPPETYPGPVPGPTAGPPSAAKGGGRVALAQETRQETAAPVAAGVSRKRHRSGPDDGCAPKRVRTANHAPTIE